MAESVIITGASGHAGANLVRALLERGDRVRALVHRQGKAIEGLDVDIKHGDVRELDSLCRAFEGVEVVYHLAARISLSMNGWDEIEGINVKGVRNVVEACLRTGVRKLVHFSSIHAFCQQPLDIPLDETRALVCGDGDPPYDRSKAMGEMEVSKGIERGLDAVIINPTAVVGPYDYYPSHFGQALISMAEGKLPAIISSGFDWVDARDVAQGAIAAREHAPAGSKYLLSGHWVSMYDIACMIEKITGCKAPGFVCPMWLAPAGVPFMSVFAHLKGTRPIFTGVTLKALSGNRTISHEKASRKLGYNPRPFLNTLYDTLDWFARNGYLSRRIKELSLS
jgi:dihydroflavonol-4-reductase